MLTKQEKDTNQVGGCRKCLAKEVLLEIKLKGCVYVRHYILRNQRESRDSGRGNSLCKNTVLKKAPCSQSPLI